MPDTPPNPLEFVRIVLVRPIRPGNIGAICRAMTNMGLRDLCLVAPQCDPQSPEAVGFAARARPLLDAARIVPDIPAALTDCVLSWAATGKGGMYRRQAAEPPRAAVASALQTAARGDRVAFVFGPEDRGLLVDEILLFDRVLCIPADQTYPVLNLAAAVTVVAYELFQAAASPPTAGADPPSEDAPPAGEPLAGDDRKRMLFEHFFRGLDRIGFFRGQQRDHHLEFALRRVLGRAGLTVNECDILLGVAKQMNWYVDQHGQHPAARSRPAE